MYIRTTTRCHEKHGEGSPPTKEYMAWYATKQRCTNIKNKAFKNYGGRGITMCDQWINSYSTFLSDMGRAPSARHSIDRKDNTLGYSPENCRWATPKEQCRNRRNSVWVEFEGEKITPFDLSKKLNINYRTLMYKIRGRDVKKNKQV